MLSKRSITVPTVNCSPVASEVVFWAILSSPLKSSKSRGKGLGQPLDQKSRIKNHREVISKLQIENASFPIP